MENAGNIKIGKKLLSMKEFYSSDRPAVTCTEAQLRHILEFNDRIKNGLAEFESVPCLCGCTEFDLVASVDRYAMLQNTVMCRKCGLIQSNPRMTNKEYSNFYSSDTYRLCYEGEDYIDKCEDKYNLQCVRHIFDEVNKTISIDSKVSVLEIGAGGGWNLLPFINADAEVLGMDYSPSLTQLGKRHGIPMKQGSVDDIAGQFDIIIVNHLLEHLSDPVSSLRKISQHLKTGGVVYIAVPNILNFGIGQLQNAHTYYFTPFTLECYCREAGLKLIRSGKAQNIHLFGIFKPFSEGKDRSLKYRRAQINFTIVKFKTILKRLLRYHV